MTTATGSDIRFPEIAPHSFVNSAIRVLGILARAFADAQRLDAELRAPIESARPGNRGGAMTDEAAARAAGQRLGA